MIYDYKLVLNTQNDDNSTLLPAQLNIHRYLTNLCDAPFSMMNSKLPAPDYELVVQAKQGCVGQLIVLVNYFVSHQLLAL